MSEKGDALLRQYASGEITWQTLRLSGFDNYADVLIGLGDQNLRPQIAPIDGPNQISRQKSRALLRQRLIQLSP